ncbi:MAG: HAD family hydrolase [Candidatus Verstraetearchaeota archaeon]|nr:HAD family hydrolase [Candidatus Verstraetearchaeota archaeon]
MRIAIVFDVSGTILKPYRVVVDCWGGKLLKEISVIELVSSAKRALVNLEGPLSRVTKDPGEFLEKARAVASYYVGISKEEAVKIYRLSLKEEENFRRIAEGLKAAYLEVLRTGKTKYGTGLAVIVDGEIRRPSHCVGLGGELYPGIVELIGGLKKRGIDFFLVSGNCRNSVGKLAKKLGISSYFTFANADPYEKAEIVERLKGFYGLVFMIGNDLNDYEAMIHADISVLTLQDGEEKPRELFEVADYVVEETREILGLVDQIIERAE